MSGSELDAYLTATSIKFVSLTGTLSISGNYYNLKVDGAATATGSLSFPNKGQIDESLDGKKVTATGYLFSVSKSGDAPKFANMMVATIAEEENSVLLENVAFNLPAWPFFVVIITAPFAASEP